MRWGNTAFLLCVCSRDSWDSETHEQSKQSSVRTSDLKSELPLTLTSEGPRETMSPPLAAAGSHQHKEKASSKESETKSGNQTLRGIQISSWRQGTRYCVTEYSCLHKPIFISKTSPGGVLLWGPIKLKTKLYTRTAARKKKKKKVFDIFLFKTSTIHSNTSGPQCGLLSGPGNRIKFYEEIRRKLQQEE